MKKFILAKKLKMTTVFDEDGRAVPVTILKAGPCQVTQIKSKEKDGYQAVQVGFEKLKENKIGKSQRKKPFRYLREFRIRSQNSEVEGRFRVGDEIGVGLFEKGDLVKVSGVCKGRGFQGVVKRHGFAGGPATHGQKDRLRAPGSIGATTPSRVIKGKKMPGRMGPRRVTIKNLRVVDLDEEENLLTVSGAIPGSRGSLVVIESEK